MEFLLQQEREVNNINTQKLVRLGMFVAIAIALNIFESIFIGPIFYTVRLGLSNIVALIVLETDGPKEMIIVNVVRVLTTNLLRGLIFSPTFWISFGGIACSSIVLILLDKMDSSIWFKSICSAIAHSVGQLIVVSLFYMNARMAVLLPYLILASIPMGLITAFLSEMVLKRIHIEKK